MSTEQIKEAINGVADSYTQLTYFVQDEKHHMENQYSVSLPDAMTFIGLPSITSSQCPVYLQIKEQYLENKLYNFQYAQSNIDQNGHYIYQFDSDNNEMIYFTIIGLKYFSLIYPSRKQSIIALYYINLESDYLKFTKDAYGFLK
jgi:hypothetical protein